MNKKQSALFQLRLALLSEKQRKQLYEKAAEILYYSDHDLDEEEEHAILRILNQLLIEKYGEMSVYDYLKRDKH